VERVLRAALALADAEGIEGLTMRQLGRRLGVEAMSLYKHVPNKDAVIDGIVDLVVGEIALPSAGDAWQAAMRRRGISAHEVLMRHPWACRPLISRVNVGPAMVRYTDSTLGVLREAGFSVELADRAWNAMDSHIYGFTVQRLNFPFEPEQFPEAAKTYRPLLSQEEHPYLTEMADHVIRGDYDGMPDFTFGLDLILDGLDRLLRASHPKRR
jgi:AcrR family transcriptional regulator